MTDHTKPDLDALAAKVAKRRAQVGGDDPRNYISGLSVADADALIAEIKRLQEVQRVSDASLAHRPRQGAVR